MISLGIQTCMLDMSGLVYLKETSHDHFWSHDKAGSGITFILYRHTWLLMQAQVQHKSFL